MNRLAKKEWMKYFKYAIRYIGVPFLVEIIIESFNRKSFFGGFAYMIQWPSLFVFNALIIMLTMSIALFFKREIFVYVTITAVWLLFGIVNFVVLNFRVTPFSAVDITLLESAISVSGHYLNPLNVAMIVLGALLVIAALIALFFMAPKHTHRTQKRIIVSFISVALIVSALAFIHSNSNSVKALDENYTNIAEAYENYGFVYCFTNSIIDTGIEKPEDYDEAHVQEIINGVSGQQSAVNVKPNIIFVQLESFFDVSTLRTLQLSKDPIPNFHNLQNNFSSGLLSVPTVGAGTVNTEFEVLTGMSQKDFGTSEYPYKTILRKTTAESICYDLKNLGYATHCVHNNEGTFYGRNKVYKNLGFDTFTSMEFMNGLEDNPNGWKKDRILTGEILNTLDATPGADFTLAITVQSHGKYKGFDLEEDEEIQVEQSPEGMEDSYSYYVSQIYEVDQMIGDLVSALEKRQEPSILVLYGDHLPSLDIKKSDLIDSNLYQTQYVVWNNLGLESRKKNLTSYQLYPEVLKRLGISEGIITKYHQAASWKTKTYHDNLKMLEYDMLYGENYAYQGNKPFQTIETQMGTHPVTITDVTSNEKGYLVTGTGFTPYCHVLFDGKELGIQWIDSSHIQILEELGRGNDGEEAAQAPLSTGGAVPTGSVQSVPVNSVRPSAAAAGISPSPVAVISALPVVTAGASASPAAGESDGEIEKEKIPDAFLIQVKSEGGTILSESNVLAYQDTSLNRKTS